MPLLSSTDCAKARDWMFRSLDDDLVGADQEALSAHLGQCTSCLRTMKLLLLPRRLGRAIPAFEPSPYFYQRLRARLQSEYEKVTIWQIVLGLSRQVVPALATLTLALITIFAYVQLRGPNIDLYQAYDTIFTSPDRPLRMVIADQTEITDESVLRAIADAEPSKSPASEPGDAPQK